MGKQTRQVKAPAPSIAQQVEALLALLNEQQLHAYREADEWSEATEADCSAPELGVALSRERAKGIATIKGRVEALRAALIGKEG